MNPKMTNDHDEDGNPTAKDEEFELDDNIDLSSPSLRNILSDKQPAPVPCGTMVPTVTAYAEPTGRIRGRRVTRHF